MWREQIKKPGGRYKNKEKNQKKKKNNEITLENQVKTAIEQKKCMEQIEAQRHGTIGRGFCISDAKEGKSLKTVLTWYKMYPLEMPIDSEH